MMAGLQDRSAVVTGAASGIGRATALALAEAGARVLAVDLDAAGLDRLAVEPAGPGRIEPLTGDVTDAALPDRLLAALDAAGPPFGILVNNAGIARGQPADATTEADFRLYHEVNVQSAFRLSVMAVARFAAQGGGAIVNVASIFACVGATASAGYSASKAALAGLTRQMATDYGPMGVRINAVAPGLIETPLTAERIRTETWRRQIFIDQAPLRRVGQPEDVARVIRFLASDEAGFLTGQVIAVDGGWAMGRYPRPAEQP